jgi:hypothetical protein
MNTELNYSYFLANNPMFRPFSDGLADLRFCLIGEISATTPVYHLEPPMLFLYQNVEAGEGSFFKGFAYHHSREEIEGIANHLELLAGTLREEFGYHLVFMAIPNKYVLYGRPESGREYDEFVPHLEAALIRRNVPIISLYRRFRSSRELVFWPSDTHWNGKGVRIALEESVKVLRPLLQDPGIANPGGGGQEIRPATFHED